MAQPALHVVSVLVLGAKYGPAVLVGAVPPLLVLDDVVELVVLVVDDVVDVGFDVTVLVTVDVDTEVAVVVSVSVLVLVGTVYVTVLHELVLCAEIV